MGIIRFRFPAVGIIILLLMVACPGGAGASALNVTVSIRPLHALVAGIMQGVAKPKLLIAGNQSPHDFSLKPSDMRALTRADLIVWVGPGLETALSRLLKRPEFDSRTMTLTQSVGVDLLQTREGADWEAHGHETPPDQPRHETVHSEYDSHIWLSPLIARRIVQRISDRLIGMDAANADRYRTNTRHLLERLGQLDRRLRALLKPVKDRPYVVFHNAYHYFEQYYGLNAVGSVSISPERMPGAQHIHALRQKIIRLNARCVFAEPQFEPKLIHTLVAGTQTKIGQLDPLGSDLAPGPDAYFQLMQHLAENLAECLQ
jgi:zinc transport system substrate-binding protein